MARGRIYNKRVLAAAVARVRDWAQASGLYCHFVFPDTPCMPKGGLLYNGVLEKQSVGNLRIGDMTPCPAEDCLLCWPDYAHAAQHCGFRLDLEICYV